MIQRNMKGTNIMSKNFAVDVETLGIESTAVVLSVALIPFELDDESTYQELIDKAMFVKFDAKEQLDTFKRTITKSTMTFWDSLGSLPKTKSFMPDKQIDVFAKEGIERVLNYVQPDKHTTFWARGTLDQVTLDSLCRNVGYDWICPYNQWMDFRTAISLLKDTAANGYCEIPGFDRSIVVKHDPVHDCAYDIKMLVEGK